MMNKKYGMQKYEDFWYWQNFLYFCSRKKLKQKGMKQKVILITGASSGIGFDAAQKLASRGHRVYAAARRMELMGPLRNKGIEFCVATGG